MYCLCSKLLCMSQIDLNAKIQMRGHDLLRQLINLIGLIDLGVFPPGMFHSQRNHNIEQQEANGSEGRLTGATRR